MFRRRLGPHRRKAASLAAFLAVFAGSVGAALGTCGPFVDVADDSFCPLLREIFYLGITTGTTATTFDPDAQVSRLQMAALLSRTVDTVLRRGSRRAALGQFWTPLSYVQLAVTTVGSPDGLQSDGTDVWVALGGNASVARVRGSDGALLETWTGSQGTSHILVAMGKVFTAGFGPTGGRLFRIDPAEPAGTVTRVISSGLGTIADAMAFDGSRIWLTAYGPPSAIYAVTPGATLPWTFTAATGTFANPHGLTWDGTNVWATDYDAGTILRLDAAGAVLQTVTVQSKPLDPFFDGTNIWVPNSDSGSLSIVRAATGAVLATVTGNGLWGPRTAASDGERVVVTNSYGMSVSVFRAADFAPLAVVSTGEDTGPWGVCSDGINFWISLSRRAAIVRF